MHRGGELALSNQEANRGIGGPGKAPDNPHCLANAGFRSIRYPHWTLNAGFKCVGLRYSLPAMARRRQRRRRARVVGVAETPAHQCWPGCPSAGRLAAQMSVIEFYDAFADDYDLVYGGRWEEAISRQGEILGALIEASLGSGPKEVLDCSCGIGTQALGLAMRGHRVHGTDISERSVERAQREASRLGLSPTFAMADFRDLGSVPGTFDVVISCDNAIPHLLTDSEVRRALASMHAKLRAQGLLVVSIRDYDRALVERPATAPPTFTLGPPRRLLVRFHDWEEAGPIYDLHFLLLSEESGEWSLTAHHKTRYRALPRHELAAAAHDASFDAIQWHEPDATGFHQPVLTARWFVG